MAVPKNIRQARATRQTKKRDLALSVEKRSPPVPAQNVRLIKSPRAHVRNPPRPIVRQTRADTKNRFCSRYVVRSLEEVMQNGV